MKGLKKAESERRLKEREKERQLSKELFFSRSSNRIFKRNGPASTSRAILLTNRNKKCTRPRKLNISAKKSRSTMIRHKFLWGKQNSDQCLSYRCYACCKEALKSNHSLKKGRKTTDRTYRNYFSAPSYGKLYKKQKKQQSGLKKSVHKSIPYPDPQKSYSATKYKPFNLVPYVSTKPPLSFPKPIILTNEEKHALLVDILEKQEKETKIRETQRLHGHLKHKANVQIELRKKRFQDNLISDLTSRQSSRHSLIPFARESFLKDKHAPYKG